jgi:hypothetical protein
MNLSPMDLKWSITRYLVEVSGWADANMPTEADVGALNS